jgi:hypothetical protein
VDELQDLQAGGQNYKMITVLAGDPRAADYAESSNLSRGWQTSEDRRAQQIAADGHF